MHDIGLTWQTRAPLLLRPNDQQDLGPPRLAHLRAVDYVALKYMPQSMYDSYQSFAVVRNPWDRTLSLYRHLNLKISFRTFVCEWLVDQFSRKDDWLSDFWFVRPQTDYIMRGGALGVKHLVRFENLQSEVDQLRPLLDLKSPLPHVNKSKKLKSRSLIKKLIGPFGKMPDEPAVHSPFDDDIIKKISHLYRSDIDQLGYQFDH